MTRAERDEFLQKPGVLCRIATVTEAGYPHVTPVWFIYEEGRIWITPREASSWLANLDRDPKVALTIDEDVAPYRKVTVEGLAEHEFAPGRDDQWRDRYRRIACRYVPEEAADRYLESTMDQKRALISVSLAENKVMTWRMPLPGESYQGIWHGRYYAPGTKMARGGEPG